MAGEIEPDESDPIADGSRRLRPAIGDPNYLVLRRRRELFEAWLSRLDGKRWLVLDVGGRIQPYRPLVAQRTRRYVAVDVRRTALVDSLARGEELPFSSSVFDLVLCTQVLEYVRDPHRVAREIHRVLKPGGALLLSVPAVWPRDSEEDAWRFLPPALREILSEFREIEIAPEGGSLAGMFRTVNACLGLFARSAGTRAILRWTVFPAMNLLGLAFDRLRGSNDSFAVNYSALARK